MKVSVTFSEFGYISIPFEMDRQQLLVFLDLLNRYTGTGYRVEIDMEQKKTSAGDSPAMYTAEELGKVMADPADTLGINEEVLEDE